MGWGGARAILPSEPRADLFRLVSVVRRWPTYCLLPALLRTTVSFACYTGDMYRSKRMVSYALRAPRGGRETMWGYCLRDVAALLGITPLKAQRLVRSGGLNVSSLEAVCQAWLASGRAR